MSEHRELEGIIEKIIKNNNKITVNSYGDLEVPEQDFDIVTAKKELAQAIHDAGYRKTDITEKEIEEIIGKIKKAYNTKFLGVTDSWNVDTVYSSKCEVWEWIEKKLKELANRIGKKDKPIKTIQRLLKILTDNQRMEAMSGYCRYCGCDESETVIGCQCENDE